MHLFVAGDICFTQLHGLLRPCSMPCWLVKHRLLQSSADCRSQFIVAVVSHCCAVAYSRQMPAVRICRAWRGPSACPVNAESLAMPAACSCRSPASQHIVQISLSGEIGLSCEAYAGPLLQPVLLMLALAQSSSGVQQPAVGSLQCPCICRACRGASACSADA